MDERIVYNDLGAHNGNDTAYYLQKGFRVLSIDADPQACEALQTRFADDIVRGRVTVLNVALAERDGPVVFYRCTKLPLFSSCDRQLALRRGPDVEAIDVAGRSVASLIGEYGRPHYLKVDVEGCDHLAVLGLPACGVPDYVSFEVDYADAPELVRHLSGLGFDRFKLVNQQQWRVLSVPPPGSTAHVIWSARQCARLLLRRHPGLHRFLTTYVKPPRRGGVAEPSATSSTQAWVFTAGSSGPLPDRGAAGWTDLMGFLYTLLSAKAGGLLDSAWFDVHASRPSESRPLVGEGR